MNNEAPSKGKSVLIVDAAYLFAGAQKLQSQTRRKLDINQQTMNIVLEYMQQINHTEFDYKYYITAEKGESSVWYRKAFYEQISALGFTVDIRKFKGKQVFCTNKQCNNSKNGFNLQVQAEVDVAIVMKAMEHVY